MKMDGSSEAGKAMRSAGSPRSVKLASENLESRVLSGACITGKQKGSCSEQVSFGKVKARER